MKIDIYYYINKKKGTVCTRLIAGVEIFEKENGEFYKEIDLEANNWKILKNILLIQSKKQAYI